MADEGEFDFTAKKKKSKKTTFDLDGEEGESRPQPTIASSELGDEGELDFSKKKKKKKKKKVFNELDAETTGDAAKDAEGKDSKEEDKETETTAPADLDGDLDFSLTKKKKKKKKAIAFEDEGKEGGEGIIMEGEDEGDPDSESSAATGTGPSAWANSDRDYTYDELLNLVFMQIREKNPDLAKGEKKKLTMKPPQVLRVGTKKTSFANFLEICKSLHRPQKHLQAFLLAELGTSGSVDQNNQLIIKGRFSQKQIETVLRRYIKEYVVCQTCRSPDTILQKDTRLFFLQCETCSSRRSVASIKSGFQAVTGKRAAIRAKAN